MNTSYPDPISPELTDETRRTAAVEDWGHSKDLLEEDERVYMPSALSEESSGSANPLSKVREGFFTARDKVQGAIADFDREEALEKGRALITAQPWAAALVTFGLGAWLGHKITRRS